MAEYIDYQDDRRYKPLPDVSKHDPRPVKVAERDEATLTCRLPREVKCALLYHAKESGLPVPGIVSRSLRDYFYKAYNNRKKLADKAN